MRTTIVSPRTYTKRFFGLTLTSLICFFIGKETARMNPLPTIDSTCVSHTSQQEEDAHFANVVTSWNEYVIAHDGWIPSNPYAVLADLGVVDGYRELRSYRFGAFERINPNLAENPHWDLFWTGPKDRSYALVCFADGTWERQSPHVGSGDAKRLGVGAGFPMYFIGAKAREDWIQQNKDRVVWDPKQKLYVLKPDTAGAK